MTGRALPALLLLVAACASEVAGQDGSSLSGCDQLAEVTCARFFECFSEEERAAAGIPASEEDCVAATRADFQCAAESAETACAAGQTYDPAMAARCVEEYAGLTCQVLREDLDPDDTPACSRICL